MQKGGGNFSENFPTSHSSKDFSGRQDPQNGHHAALNTFYGKATLNYHLIEAPMSLELIFMMVPLVFVLLGL